MEAAAVKFEYIDHTADVGFRLQANSPSYAFVAAAEGMFDIMLSRRMVQECHSWEISVEATGWEELLVAFLEELLYRYEMHGEVPHSVCMRNLTETTLSAASRGEFFDADRHEPTIQIKAVTYHQLRASPTESGFEISVIFDI
ncbi:MAG: archease [Chloroflexota bacterium]